jgi:hypothetical protein
VLVLVLVAVHVALVVELVGEPVAGPVPEAKLVVVTPKLLVIGLETVEFEDADPVVVTLGTLEVDLVDGEHVEEEELLGEEIVDEELVEEEEIVGEELADKELVDEPIDVELSDDEELVVLWSTGVVDYE